MRRPTSPPTRRPVPERGVAEAARPRTLHERVYDFIEPERPGGELYDRFIQVLIGLTLLELILETEQALLVAYRPIFHGFEVFSVAAFTLDYLLRLWSCTAAPQYRGPVRGRLRWARTPMALIDLAAVLPFYLPFLGVDLRAFRGMRLLRLLRLAKVGRYSTALRTLQRVLARKKEELVMTLGLAGLLLLGASSLIYFLERQAQPEAFGSIPRAMWWAMATLTTIGYGDVVPVTALGRLLGSLVAVLGIGMGALPTGILGAAFVEEMQARRRGEQPRCPHCGEPLDAPPTAAPPRDPPGDV